MLKVKGKRGTSKDYCLTEYAKQAIRLGLIELDNLNYNDTITDNLFQERSIIIFLIICNLATKGKYLIFDIDDCKAERGITAKEVSKLYGGSLGFDFTKITEEEVAKLMDLLYDEGIIQKCDKTIADSNRFFISNKDLNEFIKELVGVFENRIFPRFILYWKNIRPPKPYERLFFQIHYGEKVKEKILRFQNILSQNKRKGIYKKNLGYWKYSMDLWDLDLKVQMDQIRNKHSNLIEKYPAISNILIEIFYPHFLSDRINNIENKYKSREQLLLLMRNCFNSIVKKKEGNFYSITD